MVRRALVFVLVWCATARAEVTAPAVLERADPIFPEVARGLAREVVVLITIDREGRVAEAMLEALAGDALDEVALETARRYRFSPATKDGAPVPSRVKLLLQLRAPSKSESSPRQTPKTNQEFEDVRVSGERSSPSPTRRTLERREIETIPGTFGDAIRAVETLPGAARAPAFSGLVILRGSAPRDSQVFVDGMNVPLAYHFGGLSAIVPTELIEKIDVYPGAYDVELGRGMGGVIDLALRSPAKDRPRALVKVDLLDARATVETPLGPRTRALVAARRSWFDAWFPAVAEGLGVSTTAAPVYHDVELVLEHELGARGRATLTGLTSGDRLALVVGPSAGDPSFSGDVRNATDFHRLALRLSWPGLSAQTALGYDAFDIAIGKLVKGRSEALRVDSRVKIEARMAKGLTLRAGADVQAGSFGFTLAFPPIPVADEPTIGPLFGRRALSRVASAPYLFPAAFVGLDAEHRGQLRALVGLRVEGFTDVAGVAIEPRTNARLTLDPRAARKTTLKAALGLYAQPPLIYEYDRVFGTPGVRFSQAAQASVGIEQEITRALMLSLEPYGKRLFDLVSRRADPSAESGFRNGNEGEGVAYGAELLLKLRDPDPSSRFYGYLAYTFSRSERRALPELPRRVFEYDQTHIFSAVGSARFPGGWELGARVRLISGNPYSPVVGAAFDADAGAYAGIEQQPLYSARLPAFFSLDLRVEKILRVGMFTFRAYLDVINATNRGNVEGLIASYDYRAQSTITGLPLLPNLGLRGEL